MCNLLCVSCTTTKEIIREVPVEVIHDIYHNVYIRDTTHTTDSIIMYQKGDTVFKEKYTDRFKERQIHDTLKTHDTIPVYINTTEVKTVEKRVPQWWPVWLSLGIVFIGLILTKTNTVNWIKNLIKIIIKLFK